MYAYCVYPAMSKIPKQQPNCIKKEQKQASFLSCLDGSSSSPDLYCSRFLPSDNMNQEMIYLG